MPTANTSRAALQDLATILDEASAGMGPADFATTIAVTTAGAVLNGAANYQPHSLQRMTLTPTGSLRVSGADATAPMTLAGPWSGAQTRFGSPW